MVSGGTDNHLMLVKTDPVDLTGKQSENVLEEAAITVNKNMVPGDKRSPFVTSGIRLGTPAITTRGLNEDHMVQIGDWIMRTLKNHENKSEISKVKEEVLNLCRDFPVYPK